MSTSPFGANKIPQMVWFEPSFLMGSTPERVVYASTLLAKGVRFRFPPENWMILPFEMRVNEPLKVESATWIVPVPVQ